MKVRKALITAAGRDQHALPLQMLVDQDGETKSALQILVGEALEAGVEEIGVIVQPGDEDACAAAAGDQGSLTFIPQREPLGYGHALHCGKDFIDHDPFLHLVSDHLPVSSSDVPCARQLVEVAEAEACSVSAVQATREHRLPYYGAIGGQPERGKPRLYEIEQVREKPTPTLAEQELVVPGLRSGYYLCFFGMHVLTPGIMDLLETQLAEASPAQPVQLSPALNQLAERERYVAFEITGRRYNIGLKYGLFFAQLALALHGEDREEVLAQLVEMMAMREQSGS